MRRLLAFAAVALGLTAAAVPTPALAHEGNPNYRSVVRSLTPKTTGVSLQVLNFDDRLELTNHSGKTVTVFGYNDDPYAQILGDGTVRVNMNSPAAYVNDERTEDGAKIPAGVTGKGTPRWKVQDKTGVFQWHDHRMHYMGTGTPPQLKGKDKSQRQVVFGWKVPMTVGTAKGAAAGQLIWVGKDASGAPVGAIIALVALVLLAIAATVVIRRRRAGDPDAPVPGASAEAW